MIELATALCVYKIYVGLYVMGAALFGLAVWSVWYLLLKNK